MKRSNRLLILLGVFLAVAGGLGTVVLLSGSNNGGSGGVSASPTPTAEPLTTVVVAKQDINLGDQITAAMVGTQQMTISARAALGGDTFSDASQVIGKVAGGKITKGQVLLASRDFLTPGTMVDGQSIAAAVGAGMLAVSMEVDQVNGVGTLLVPGDHVDVILSVYIDEIGITGVKTPAGSGLDLKSASQVTTKTVIQNRKVLGTLLPSETPAQNPAPAAGASATPAAGPTQAVITNTGRHMMVILEVTPDEAEILRWAQRAEKTDPQNYIDLSLALRSSKDDGAPNVTTPGITFKMLVDKYGVLPPDPRGILPPDIAKGISW